MLEQKLFDYFTLLWLVFSILDFPEQSEALCLGTTQLIHKNTLDIGDSLDIGNVSIGSIDFFDRLNIDNVGMA